MAGVRDRQQLAAKLDGFSAAALVGIGTALGVHFPARDRKTVLAAVGDFVGTPAHHDVLLKSFLPADWSLLNLLLWRMEPVSLLDVRAHVLQTDALKGENAHGQLLVIRH